MFPCDKCKANFSRQSYLIRHRNEIHFQIPQKHYLQTHEHIDCIPTLPMLTENNITRIICQAAYNNAIRNIRFFTELVLLPQQFFILAIPLIESTLQQLKDEKASLKISCSLIVTFKKDSALDESYFSVKTQPIQTLNIQQVMELLLAQIDQYVKRGSEWTLFKTNFFQMNVSFYK